MAGDTGAESAAELKENAEEAAAKEEDQPMQEPNSQPAEIVDSTQEESQQRCNEIVVELDENVDGGDESNPHAEDAEEGGDEGEQLSTALEAEAVEEEEGEEGGASPAKRTRTSLEDTADPAKLRQSERSKKGPRAASGSSSESSGDEAAFLTRELLITPPIKAVYCLVADYRNFFYSALLCFLQRMSLKNAVSVC